MKTAKDKIKARALYHEAEIKKIQLVIRSLFKVDMYYSAKVNTLRDHHTRLNECYTILHLIHEK